MTLADLLYGIELTLLGVGVGAFSGALGLGGGVLMVPAFLAFVPGMDVHTAKGTSLFIIIFVSLQNALYQNRGPGKPWRLGAVLTLGSVAGSYLSAYVTSLLTGEVVLFLFIVLLALLAVRTFFLREVEVHADQVRRRTLVTLLIGLLAGLTGGATGTGGGAVLIPLALIAGIISNERVVGLSNAVMVFTSIAGSIAHLQAEPVYPSPWIIGHVYLPLAPLLFLGAQLGSPLGYWINHHLTLRRRRIAMAGMLLLITGQLAYRLLTT